MFRASPLRARYNSFDSERYVLTLDDRAWRDDDVSPRLVRVAPDFLLRLLHLERAEIAQDDLVVIGECRGDRVERILDDVEHLLLGQPGLVADLHDEITLGYCVHIVRLRVG